MNKIKLGITFLMAVTLFAVISVYAQSDERPQPNKVEQKTVSVQSENKLEPVSIPERSLLEGSNQGYRMVTDVIDGFGGESESDNYKIPVNSGGQPTTISISQSTNYGMKAGYVDASFVRRGDPNADGRINSADIVYLINYLFAGGPNPCPMDAGDATCDGRINSADLVFLINYLFAGGPPPDSA